MNSLQLTSFLLNNFEVQLQQSFVNIKTTIPLLENTITTCLQAHNYPLQAGGKRVRPLIVLLSANAFSKGNASLLSTSFATALELIHTYSLVHDDLPCMDNDDLRRGKPTTHKIYGEAKALLVGDGLLTQAFNIISEYPALETNSKIPYEIRLYAAIKGIQILSHAAGATGMVLGQWIDIENSAATEWQSVRFLSAKKTGALLGASLELGILSAWSTICNSCKDMTTESVTNTLQLAQQIGETLGVAFQIIDDILDVTSASSTLGKTVGKDVAQKKHTSVSVLGLDGAVKQAQLETNNALSLFDKLCGSMPAEQISTENLSTLLNLFNSLLNRVN